MLNKKSITNTSSLLEEMRESRKTSNAAFITFVDNHEKFQSHVFCFYEGEDGKYYNHRIKEILGDCIIPITTGNKSETIKIWRKIKYESKYDWVKKMFFIDRDMDEVPPDKDTNLYITPCYSIENLYVDTIVFSNVLESEFSINKTEIDFVRCIELFNDLHVQFNEHMVDFNTLILLKSQNFDLAQKSKR